MFSAITCFDVCHKRHPNVYLRHLPKTSNGPQKILLGNSVQPFPLPVFLVLHPSQHCPCNQKDIMTISHYSTRQNETKHLLIKKYQALKRYICFKSFRYRPPPAGFFLCLVFSNSNMFLSLTYRDFLQNLTRVVNTVPRVMFENFVSIFQVSVAKLGSLINWRIFHLCTFHL